MKTSAEGSADEERVINPTRDLGRDVTFKQVLQGIPDREQHEQRPRNVSMTDSCGSSLPGMTVPSP